MQRVNRPKAPEDGLGWWLDYVCRLVKTYPSFTRDYVLYELPMDEGWCWYSFAFLDDAMNRFGGVKPASAAYVRQEAEKLIEQAHEAWGR